MKHCMDCGAVLSGHGNPKRCRKCAWKFYHDERVASMKASSAVHENILKASRIRWSNPNTRRYGKLSPHENVLAAMLAEAGIAYIQQYNPVGCRWVYDFFLPDLRLLLELDGQAHKYESRVKARDVEKDTWALEHGYDIGRIWVEELYSD